MTFLKRDCRDDDPAQRLILNDGKRMGRVVMINKHKLSCPLMQSGGHFVDLAKQSRYYIRGDT